MVRKDIAEIGNQPLLLVPPVLIVLAMVAPVFLITLIVPAVSGEALVSSGMASGLPIDQMRELDGLPAEAAVQAVVLQQFLIFGVLAPVLGSLSIAAHSIIGEKQSRALEPLLATPLTTIELLAAKTLVPLALSMMLLALTFAIYVGGIGAFGEPGVWKTLFSARTVVLYLGVAPLATFSALLLAAIASSRVNDARSAQQFSVMLVLPLLTLFIAQLAGRFLLGAGELLAVAAVLAAAGVALMLVGVRVFDRETILMRWK
jgi:ABC-2 type transport system permease protein